MRLNKPGGDQFRELRFEGGTVGARESDGLSVGEGFVGFEKGGELAGEGRQCGKRLLMRVEALLEAGDLLADAAEEEEQPGGPVGLAFPPSALSAAEGEAVGFLVWLDDAFQRAVGHMTVTGAQ